MLDEKEIITPENPETTAVLDEPVAEVAEVAEVAPVEQPKCHPDAKWYVVHVLSAQEQKVQKYVENSLQEKSFKDFIVQIMVPMEDIIEVQRGKKKTVQRKFFPGYILVHMVLTKETEAYIRSVPGVTGFVTTGNIPFPLSEEEVQAIVQRTQKEKSVQKTEVPFSEGDPVRVTDGPFKDFTGTVSEVHKERGKVRVMVSIFGRLTPVDVDFMQLREDRK